MTLRFVTGRGSPAEIGIAYGTMADDDIKAAIAFYRKWAEQVDARWEALVADTKPFMDAARDAAPGAVEEMEGIARGAGVPAEDLAVLNCFEEVWPDDVEACTSVATPRFLLHAEMWTAGHARVVVLRAEPSDSTPFVSPTCAGFLPAVGLNDAGFALGVDSLAATDDDVGVPRCFVARAALGADSIQGAQAAMAMPGRSGGYGYVLGAPNRSLVTETSASTCISRKDENVHTNHYLFSEPPGRSSSTNSVTRLTRAREFLAQGEPADLEACKAFLSDHANQPDSICRHAERDTDTATVFGMICDTVSGDVFASDGNPCSGGWARARDHLDAS
jgi:isopenicillin-N N-acyltransferase-like protein